MNKIRLRTKIEAVVVVSFLILISVSSVYSVTRTISGTQDTVDTYIRNSNGKYWSATASNIQSAIDDLGSNGGVVWLPNATISVMQVWINESGISLIGHNTCIKLDETKALDFTDGQGVLTIQADFVTVDGVEIDGSMDWNGTNMPAFTTVNINGIYMNQVKNCTIRNIELHHVQFNGIEMYQSYHNVIEDNHVHHIGNISNCTSVGASGIRGKSTGTGCRYNTVQNNYVHDIREHGIKFYEASGYDYEWYHNKILYNTVENVNMGNWDGGAQPYGYMICMPSCGNLIMGNILIVNDLAEAGITSRKNNTIVDNIIRDKSTRGKGYILVSQGDCVVSNNHIDGADLPPYSGGDKVAVGINLDRASNCTITNNWITHCRYPIKIHSKAGDGAQDNATGNIVTNNILYGGEGLVLKTDDSIVPGTVNNIITNNNFQGLTGADKIIESGADRENNTIKDNIGYDYSSYLAVPTAITALFGGSMYWDGSSLQIYDGGWNEIGTSGTPTNVAPSLARIRNSNNNSWAWDNTMVPIKAAMDDLNNKSGWVKLPPPSVTNTRINDGPDITSTFLLSEYGTLYCNDNWFDVKVGKYEHAFEMNIGSVLKDCHVNAKPYYTSNGSLNWEGAAVFVNGSRHFKWEYGGFFNCRCRVKNLYVEADYPDAEGAGDPIWHNNATGLYLSAKGAGYSIQYCIFENIFTQDCKYGVKMMVSGGGGCNINNNYFINCISSTDEYAIYMNGSSEASTEIAQNNFERCVYQCDSTDSGDSPEKGIVVVEGPGNRFEKYMFWDMNSMSPSTAVILQLESSTENTFFEASGALLVNDSGLNPSLNGNCVVDNGTDNNFFMIGYSDFWLDGINARHLQMDKINCWSSDSTGDTIEIFKDGDTDVRPSVIISGDVSDTDYEGTLKIESDGNFSISSSDSQGIELIPSSDIVTIDDILQLIGRTIDPPSLADGMIWYNTTTDLFYCRAGGATYTFNLTAV